MKIPDKIYDVLKWVAQIVLPAAGTLYFALASIWGLPYGEQVVGTITAADAFLGALLGVSAMGYTGDGTLHVDTTDPKVDRYSLDFTTPLLDVDNKKSVTLKVEKK